MTIPVADLADFTEGGPELKSSSVRLLGTAFEEFGFVKVKNHGIPGDLIRRLYGEVQQFFSLPLVKKLRYEVPGLSGQRGYTSFGREHAKGCEEPELKEFFQYGQNPDPGETSLLLYPPNVEVREIEGFDNTFYDAYRAFEVSGESILQAIALYLGLSGDYFTQYIHLGNSILRAIHYPPIISEPWSAIRAERHEDINLITLLVGAGANGLQILTRNGDWMNVSSLQDQIVVKVGDMLQRITNNKLKSTTQRAVNAPRELWHTSRFSIRFFLHPRNEMPLACLPSCVDEKHPRLYADITAGAYLDQRLREIGLKK